MSNEPPIVVTDRLLDRTELTRLVGAYFVDMIKYVVDVRRGRVAVGGELHADAEQLLLEDGSEPADLWGANYFPGRGADGCIEFTALINIKPAQDNRGMEIRDPDIRERVRSLTFHVIGRGEPL